MSAKVEQGQLLIEVEDGKPAQASVVADTEVAVPEQQALAVPTSTSPSELLVLAIQRDLDIEKLRALVEMDKERRREQAKAAYDAALARFGKFKKIVQHNRKGTTAGNAGYTYADFPQMVGAINEPLAECGLSFTHRQDPPVLVEGEIAYVMVYCQIRHEAGHREEFPYLAMPDLRLKGKVSPSQLIQLAITYAKRQSLAEGLGLATSEDKHDDDSHGNKAVDLITESQAADLQAKIEEVGADKATFLKFLKVEKIGDIPAKDFQRALNALSLKAKQNEKGKQK